MLAQLIQSFLTGETSRATQRMRRAMIDYIVAAICLAIGAGFLIAAGYIFVAERYGALYTAIGFGLGFIAFAGAALIFHRVVSGIQARRRAEEARAAQVKTLAGILAVTALPALLKNKGGLLGVLGPILAMAAYAVYQENSGRGAPDADGND